MSPEPVSVVIPVRNGERLLPPLLRALAGQSRPPAEVIVVDDASTDATQELAGAAGARVIPGSGGPYRSRNLGWRAATAPVVAFVDVRSRPRPRWLQLAAALFTDPAVAMATSRTEVVGGDSLVERASVAQQVFDVAGYVDNPWFLPYFATCNLLVRRGALVAVDGFRQVRSGGDADLCWRIQLAGLGSIAVAREPLMQWQARSGLRDALEQTSRYGRSRIALTRRFAADGAPAHTLVPAPRMAAYVGRAAIALAIRSATGRQQEHAARNLVSLYRGASWWGSWRETRHPSEESTR